MTRPLMQQGVGQLEELFAKSKADVKVLKQLEFELQFRQVPRAIALLAQVQDAMRGAESVASPLPPRPTPPAPTMSLEVAYKLLKSTPSSTWESVERTRRQLVMASHPEKLKGLADGARAQALAQASQVNAAYALLSRARCADG